MGIGEEKVINNEILIEPANTSGTDEIAGFIRLPGTVADPKIEGKI